MPAKGTSVPVVPAEGTTMMQDNCSTYFHRRFGFKPHLAFVSFVKAAMAKRARLNPIGQGTHVSKSALSPAGAL